MTILVYSIKIHKDFQIRKDRGVFVKTNHRRGFIDPGSFRDRSCKRVAGSKISGAAAGISNDFTNGHRGQAKAKRGAKKFVRVMDRLYLKRELEKIEKEFE